MNRSRTAAISLAMAVGALAPIGLASSAQAVPVSHDGCTLSVDTPAFTNHWTLGGVKQVDYVYHLTCTASAVGVSVEIDHERWESDRAGWFGDPNEVEDFTGSSTQNKSFSSLGGTKNVTVRAVRPITDDTDGDEEVYQNVRFRVTNGAVTGTWSARNLSLPRTIAH